MGHLASGGGHTGTPVLSPEMIRRLGRPLTSGKDKVALMNITYGPGVTLRETPSVSGWIFFAINDSVVDNTNTRKPLFVLLALLGRNQRWPLKVHGANMGPTWVLSAPDRPHVGPMNLAIRALESLFITWIAVHCFTGVFCTMHCNLPAFAHGYFITMTP